MNNNKQRILLTCHGSEYAWIKAAVKDISLIITQSLQHQGHARILLSGGTTPAPVYTELAKQTLPWQWLLLGLADERCVPADNPNSNAWLIQTHFLQHASEVTFQPLFVPDQALEQSVAAANQQIAQYPPPCLVVLGMGNDGHTSSLFPRAIDLDSALSSSQAYAALDASGCPVAGDFPQRITLTAHGIASCQNRLLLLRGQKKLEVLQAALDSNEVQHYPILAAINAPGPRLRVHWCA